MHIIVVVVNLRIFKFFFSNVTAFSFHFPILLLRPTERSKGANKFIFGASRFLSFNCYDNSHRLGKDNVFFSIDFIFPSI
jgi:hypothetical protein